MPLPKDAMAPRKKYLLVKWIRDWKMSRSRRSRRPTQRQQRQDRRCGVTVQ